MEMILQIAKDYAGIPDPRSMPVSEIRIYYDGIRDTLRESTKQ